MSRRHLINSFDVFVIKGFTVALKKLGYRTWLKITRTTGTRIQDFVGLWKLGYKTT